MKKLLIICLLFIGCKEKVKLTIKSNPPRTDTFWIKQQVSFDKVYKLKTYVVTDSLDDNGSRHFFIDNKSYQDYMARLIPYNETISGDFNFIKLHKKEAENLAYAFMMKKLRYEKSLADSLNILNSIK